MRELVPIHLLEAFVEVCRAGTVSGAARALHRTQPAVSYRINQLEETTQAKLFERTSPRWTLTSRGELLLNEAESILARSRGIHDILHQSDEEPRGRVTIGALPTLARHYLVDHLADLIREYPNVQWSIRIGVGNLIEELHSGEIDVLYFIGHLDVHGLEVHEIEPISMVYAISPELWPGENPPSVEELSE